MKIDIQHLTGRRSKLIPLDESHTERLFAAGQEREIWTYMTAKISRLEHMRQMVRKALKAKEEGKEYPFTIIDQETDTVVGSTRFLDISVPHRNLEIGSTWLSPRVHRTAINTECKFLLLRYCFETLGTVRVQIKTDLRNLRSQKAIERIGGVKEGILRRHRILPDGYIRDTVYYSILDLEWPKVKSHLIGLLNRV